MQKRNIMEDSGRFSVKKGIGEMAESHDETKYFKMAMTLEKKASGLIMNGRN